MQLLWLDIETTGLNPVEQDILEVAFELTDEELNIEKKFHRVYPLRDYSMQKMCSYVREMHTKNGLIDECREAEGQADFYKDFRDFFNGLDKPHPIGYNPGFDIGFINEWYVITPFIHHRIIDLNSIILMSQLRGKPIPKLEGDHRVLSDIKIAQRQYLRVLGEEYEKD